MISILVLCLAGGFGSASISPSPAEERLSLEQLLERYREERERLFQSLRAQLNSALTEIESAYETHRKERLEPLREKVLQLGPEAAPLLLQQLDPGPEAQDPVIGRARQIGLVLRKLSTRSISVELLSMLENGSREGQSNALVALSGSDDPERVGPVLRARFKMASQEQRAELISAIANLGGEANFAFIGEILENKDPAIVKAALGALTESRCTAAAPRILALVRSKETAAAQVPEILAYYRACPAVLNEEHVGELVHFAQALRSNAKMASDVLQLVSEHVAAWTKKTKKDLEDLSEDSNRTISEAALVCLARSGDRGAKKKLLDRYDAMVEKNGRIASNWQRRAEIKYQIGDYKGALKDFQEARRTSEEYLRTDTDIYIGMSRCFLKLGKLKEAVEILEGGGLSIAQLHLLAKDPDFAELMADEKLRKVFRLAEE
jgi:tetratricopeptide (TPR) repeat protein